MLPFCLAGMSARADESVSVSHAISVLGKPALPADFPYFPYVNPNAPKGGEVRCASIGTFDNFNPFILRGTAPLGMVGPWVILPGGSSSGSSVGHVWESLLITSADEADAAYGHLAQAIELPQDRMWVAFELKPAAKFSDGTPVSAADVAWTYNTLMEQGRPAIRIRDDLAPGQATIAIRMQETPVEAQTVCLLIQPRLVRPRPRCGRLAPRDGRVVELRVSVALPRLAEIGIDPLVLGFTFAISLLSGLLFGLIPVLKYAGPHLASFLRGGGRTLSESRERQRARNTLVVVQVGLALVLLVGSGLMIRTFQALRNVQPGFTRPDEVQLVHITIPDSHVKEAERVMRMQNEMMEKLAAIPGVTSVAFANSGPLEGFNPSDLLYAQDKNYGVGEIPPLRRFRFVTPGFFHTAGTVLIAGRDFSWTDLY